MTTGLAQRVRVVARRLPAATAVLDGERAISYHELDLASSAVASRLREHGVRPGDAVAVRLPRTWLLVATLVGIRRLGAIVVPLDAQSPPDRQRHILADSASVAVIGISAGTWPTGLPCLAAADLVTGHHEDWHADDHQDPRSGDHRPGQADAGISFLFYTSGTTGQPKGVEVRDAGITRLAQPGYLALAEGARYACVSNPAFDALSFEVWAPLLTGGCCVLLDDETIATPHRLDQALRRHRIDAMFVTTALFNAVTEAVPQCFASVGHVLVGGEQLTAAVIRRWYARNPDSATQLYNAYGPTEATTFALSYPIPREFAGSVVPIGRPLPGTQMLLVTDGTRLADPGEVAELYLGGEAIAAGYRNLPAETASRFTTLPWHDGGASRYYRTGDLVRRGDADLIEYLGRVDRQVKVRGFRIEPEEIERQLTAHAAIRQAYVGTGAERADSPLELLAYLVTDGELSFTEVEQHLTATVPGYMRPHRIYLVDELPRNANGKIDHDRLLALELEPWRPAAVGQTASQWQREVLALAGQVLGGREPRLTDSFVASGGDSLASLRLRFAIRERWGCDLPQAVVLRSDLAGLAEAIATARAAGQSRYPAPVRPATQPAEAPATSEQQRLWLLQQQDRVPPLTTWASRSRSPGR